MSQGNQATQVLSPLGLQYSDSYNYLTPELAQKLQENKQKQEQIIEELKKSPENLDQIYPSLSKDTIT